MGVVRPYDAVTIINLLFFGVFALEGVGGEGVFGFEDFRAPGDFAEADFVAFGDASLGLALMEFHHKLPAHGHVGTLFGREDFIEKKPQLFRVGGFCKYA